MGRMRRKTTEELLLARNYENKSATGRTEPQPQRILTTETQRTRSKTKPAPNSNFSRRGTEITERFRTQSSSWRILTSLVSDRHEPRRHQDTKNGPGCFLGCYAAFFFLLFLVTSCLCGEKEPDNSNSPRRRRDTKKNNSNHQGQRKTGMQLFHRMTGGNA